MDPKSGLPPEILVLCTTAETKEQALKLLDWIQRIPDKELAREPAMPAICSLMASEQLGNTVVTERRALQWSRTTQERFRTIMGKVQTLLDAKMHHSPQEGHLTLETLVAEYCSDQNELNRVMTVEKAFTETAGSEKWPLDTDLVQLSLFVWACRHFQINTLKSVDEIQQCRDLPTDSVDELHKFLDAHCHTLSEANTLDDVQEIPRRNLPHASTSNRPATIIETPFPETRSVSLDGLGRQFGVSDHVMSGMRYLDKMVRESDDFKNLVDWSSILGRCAVFYWTCSVLKVNIPAVKQITLRNQFHLRKKDFDKILSELDRQRSDLRSKLNEYFTENPPSHVLPKFTRWISVAPKPPKAPNVERDKSAWITVVPKPPKASNVEKDKSASPDRSFINGKASKRGRPQKANTPPIIFLDPISNQENELSPLCSGPALRRGLLLLRSFNARSHLAPEMDHVPAEALPPIIAFLASRQLADGNIGERQALQASGLTEDVFVVTLARLRASVDIFDTRRPFSPQTTFDELALEHGLGIHPVVSMLQVRHALKESRCLSVGMDWESPLVKCSVFFWTCAILKVPDVKQTVLRARSLVSKREFDSMLQLLNSHCTTVREQLEGDFGDTFVFAPPPFMPLGSATRDETNADDGSGGNDKQKHANGDSGTPFEMDSEELDSQCYSYMLPKKPGRPSGYRKAGRPARAPVPGVGAIFIPTTPFPPPDWKPPESLSTTANLGSESSSSVCPPSETGDSKRRHTRYSTADYQDLVENRLELWKPDGEEIKEQEAQYRLWEEKMAQDYGPQWETNISHEKPGIPFE